MCELKSGLVVIKLFVYVGQYQRRELFAAAVKSREVFGASSALKVAQV